MTPTTRASRTRSGAATRRIAASSVAAVAAGYDRSLRPRAARVSRRSRTICTGGERQ